jgi:hypothetical protein
VAIGVKAEVPNMKMFLKDQSNNKFRSKFAKFKVEKEFQKEIATDKNKAKEFVEKMKEELKEEPEGLMAKESE